LLWANIFMLFMLARKLAGSAGPALAVALLCAANYVILFFKDMVHFDQPGLFGFLLAAYAAAVYWLDGRDRPLYLFSLAAVSIGRGYCALAVLLLWVMMELVRTVAPAGRGWRAAANAWLRGKPVKVLLVSAIWSATLLSYNVAVEAQKRGVSLPHTSIVESAARRLGLTPVGRPAIEARLEWRSFAVEQAKRIIVLCAPMLFPERLLLENRIVQYSLASVYGLLLITFVPRRVARIKRSGERYFVILLLLSGFVWLFPMKRLAAPHGYTAMYYVGVPLVLYSLLMSLACRSKTLQAGLLALSAVVFVVANSFANLAHAKAVPVVNEYTEDAQSILHAIGPGEKNIHVEGGYESLVPGARFAAGFYLDGHCLTPLPYADFVITRDIARARASLTPRNRHLFLVRVHD
jgi:hypothetical protein